MLRPGGALGQPVLHSADRAGLWTASQATPGTATPSSSSVASDELQPTEWRRPRRCCRVAQEEGLQYMEEVGAKPVHCCRPPPPQEGWARAWRLCFRFRGVCFKSLAWMQGKNSTNQTAACPQLRKARGAARSWELLTSSAVLGTVISTCKPLRLVPQSPPHAASDSEFPICASLLLKFI